MDPVITESRDVKAMIAGFEKQIKAQDQELMTRETRHREQGAELIYVKAKLEERRMTAKEREITNIRSDADTMGNVLLAHNIVLGKDGHYETMQYDKEGTKKQPKEKVKELMNKSIEVERLSHELNQCQLDCWAARDKTIKAEQTLGLVQNELDTMRTLADDHANLKWQYDTLTNKHKAGKAELAEKSKKGNNKLAGQRYADNRRCGKPTSVLPGDRVLLKNSRATGKLATNFDQTPYIVERRECNKVTE